MANPNVQNNGGPVIGNAQIVPIIWGNSFPYNQGSPLPGQLLSFLQFFVGPGSPMMAMLHEYSANGVQIGPGSVVNNQIITPPGNPPAALSDSQIQSQLQSWIANQNNQTPNFPQPNANTIYVIFLPQAVTVTAFGAQSCSTFGGYHNFNGVTYAVINCCTPPNTPFAAVLNAATLVCSHEIAESITDPLAGSGWLDANTNPRDEIGDICQGIGYPQFNSAPGNAPAGGGKTFQIQAIWSQSQNNCVYGPPAKLAALTLPNVVFGGQQISGSVTLTELVPTLPPGGATVTLTSTDPAVHFNPSSVTITPGNLSATINAVTTAVPNSLVAILKAAVGGQTLQHLLTVLAPDIASFKYTPGAAQGYEYPPNSPAGSLALNVPAPVGGLIVSVVSSEKLLALPIPDELSIAAGAVSPSVNFYLQVNPASANTPVTLTASVADSSVPFTFEVLAGGPPNIVVNSLNISPATVIGGATTWGHFTLLTPVGPGGGSIPVASTDTTVATVQSPLHLGPGATGGSFAIQTKALQQPIHIKHSTIEVGESGSPKFALLTVTS